MPAKIRPTIIKISRHRGPLQGKRPAAVHRSHQGQARSQARKAERRRLRTAPTAKQIAEGLAYRERRLPIQMTYTDGAYHGNRGFQDRW